MGDGDAPYHLRSGDLGHACLTPDSATCFSEVFHLVLRSLDFDDVNGPPA